MGDSVYVIVAWNSTEESSGRYSDVQMVLRDRIMVSNRLDFDKRATVYTAVHTRLAKRKS